MAKSALAKSAEATKIDREIENAIGVQRITKYHTDRCQEVIEILTEGYSLMAAAGAMGITYGTLLSWRDKYPEFSDACEEGLAARVYALEQQVFELDDATKANVRLRALKNANKEAWADKTETETNVTISLVDVLRKIHDEKLERAQTIPFVEAAE